MIALSSYMQVHRDILAYGPHKAPASNDTLQYCSLFQGALATHSFIFHGFCKWLEQLQSVAPIFPQCLQTCWTEVGSIQQDVDEYAFVSWCAMIFYKDKATWFWMRGKRNSLLSSSIALNYRRKKQWCSKCVFHSRMAVSTILLKKQNTSNKTSPQFIEHLFQCLLFLLSNTTIASPCTFQKDTWYIQNHSWPS